jgi:hypothetical protein
VEIVSNFLSYVFTGLPADASERAKRAHMFLSYALIAVLVMVLVLATVPSWPLAFGVAIVCTALGYIAKLVLAGPASNGS